MKNILTYALIISIVIVFWGCGEDVEECGLLTTAEVIPPEGSEIEFNSEIAIKFNQPVTKVTVNGVCAAGSGMMWIWKAYLDLGPTILNIGWTNEDCSTGIKSISYIVKESEDVGLIQIGASCPKDGKKNVDPLRLKSDGIEIEFDNYVKKVDVDIIVNGVETVKWSVEVLGGRMNVFRWNIGDVDIPYDSEVILAITVEHLLGYKMDLGISFTTKTIE